MRRYDRSREKENEAHQEEERGRHGKERARAKDEQKGKDQTHRTTAQLLSSAVQLSYTIIDTSK